MGLGAKYWILLDRGVAFLGGAGVRGQIRDLRFEIWEGGRRKEPRGWERGIGIDHRVCFCGARS